MRCCVCEKAAQERRGMLLVSYSGPWVQVSMLLHRRYKRVKQQGRCPATEVALVLTAS